MSTIGNQKAVGSVPQAPRQSDPSAVPAVTDLSHEQMKIATIIDPCIGWFIVTWLASAIVYKGTHRPVVSTEMKNLDIHRLNGRRFDHSRSQNAVAMGRDRR